MRVWRWVTGGLGGFPFRIRRTKNGAGDGVEAIAAPEPILRMLDQASTNGIEVHIVQFFVFLSEAPYIEVVEAALPKARIA